jgi:hypothetical protein
MMLHAYRPVLKGVVPARVKGRWACDKPVHDDQDVSVDSQCRKHNTNDRDDVSVEKHTIDRYDVSVENTRSTEMMCLSKNTRSIEMMCLSKTHVRDDVSVENTTRTNRDDVSVENTTRTNRDDVSVENKT